MSNVLIAWEALLALVIAIASYFVSFSPHAPRSRLARTIVIATPVFLLVVSQYLWATTGRGLLERATCVFLPSGASCRPPAPAASAPASTSAEPKTADRLLPASPIAGTPITGNPVETAPPPAAKPGAESPIEPPAQHGSKYVTLTEANAKDIWSTSVYSYAPGGGGPGGGLENDRLRIGGWGDEYVALLQFDLPDVSCGSRVSLELYNNNDSRSPTPMYLNVITAPWDWQRGDRLWWRNMPSSQPWENRVLPAPGLNAWFSIDITSLFQKWCTKELPNYGLMLRPVENNNNYDTFYSTRYSGSADLRPRLVISD